MTLFNEEYEKYEAAEWGCALPLKLKSKVYVFVRKIIMTKK